MAIKGKGRTKSRPTARAPRPAPVVRRPPFFVRRWVQVVLAVVAGMLVVVAAIWVTNGLRRSDADEARIEAEANARRVVGQWQATVDAMIATVGSPGDGLGQVVVFPSLATSVETLAKGDEDNRAEEVAATAGKLADEAVTTLQAVDLPTIITDNEGLDLATTNYVLGSKARMIDGLELYGEVAAGVKTSVTADDPAVAKPSVDRAKALLTIAERVFDEGYSDYTEALGQVGLLQPTPGLSGLSGLSGNSAG